MTEIESRGTEIKTVCDGLVRWLCMGEDRLSELEIVSLESSETRTAKRTMTDKTDEDSKNCGTTTTDTHVNSRKRRKRENEEKLKKYLKQKLIISPN